jgi:RNA polymerase sigma factor (sigma-70 family)
MAASLLALAASAIILSRQDQIDTCRDFQETGSKSALDALIQSNIRMAIKIARKYHRGGLDLEDMVTEATMGILEAATKYDFDSAASFTSYATLWMRAKVQAYVQENCTPVHTGTRAARKLYASLPKLRRTHGDDLTPAQIAEHLKLDEQDVIDLLPVINHGGVSIDKPIGEDGKATIGDMFVDSSLNPEQQIIKAQESHDLLSTLEQFAEGLNERDSQIYEGRIMAPFRGEDATPAKELAEIFGVSKQRMSQLEKRVRDNLKNHMIAARQAA